MDFIDPELMNYCSDMQVRLAFGVMSHASSLKSRTAAGGLSSSSGRMSPGA
jgi:hypothetical protein